jgi:EmrB/QacA subfamily drug resistance transporter
VSTIASPTQTASIRTMNHRQVLQALIALMAAFFVVILSGTVVATSLPVIISDIGGTQADYTWIVTANFLTMAISTPIWGKLADIFDRKLLIQISLVIFTLATVVAGFATTASWLITCRFFQGIGVGGLMALGMVAIADLVSPRERGRYMGIMGAIMGIAQIGGPLLGGVVTDTLGWEWNFFLPVPVAVVAFILIQVTLHLPRHKRKIKVDVIGAALIALSIGLILVWMTLGGKDADSGGFAWDSTASIAMIVAGSVLLIGAVFWELYGTKEPIVPLRLFKQRTFALATIASLSVGVTMFGATVFLSQYLQLARGLTPTESGLFTIPMVLGSLGASLVFGQLITRTGRWKGLMVVASIALIAGLGLFGTIHYDTSMWLVGTYMALLGIGTGGLLQNLLLVTQNQLPPKQMGAGTGAVTFFRSLGGTVGIAVLGSLLGSWVAEKVAAGMAALDPAKLLDPSCAAGLQALQAGTLPHPSDLCEPVRTVIESSYGDSIAMLFWVCVPLAILTLIAVIFLPNKALSRKTNAQQLEEELGAEFVALEPIDAAGDLAPVEGGPILENDRHAGPDARS